MAYEEIKKLVYERIKDVLEQKPLSAEEIHNPMKQIKKEELYNAIFCYDTQKNICGFNIQLRIEEQEAYKYRFYLPLVDSTWNGVKNPKNLPDKKIKVGFDGEYISQNELLNKNDLELADAMYLNLKIKGVVWIGGGYVGILYPDLLYPIARGFKYAGYPINDATKKMNDTRLFV